MFEGPEYFAKKMMEPNNFFGCMRGSDVFSLGRLQCNEFLPF